MRRGIEAVQAAQFVDAVAALSEPVESHFIWRPQHSENEDRSRTYGMSGKGLLVVVHTDRPGKVRIISARKANDMSRAPGRPARARPPIAAADEKGAPQRPSL